jgi:aminoglycoside/choline kinase family phosphotransferase
LPEESRLPPRPVPADLLPWALSALCVDGDGCGYGLTAVAGDASQRRYFRLAVGDCSYIVVEAPPATEKNDAFLAVRAVLADAGVAVPAVYGADPQRGYLLLQDLGDRLLLPSLDETSVDGHYERALEILRRIATLEAETLDLPLYDRALLREELGRCPQWFVEGLLGYRASAAERDLFERLSTLLVDAALEQPRVLVHRDFHSRNLMLQPGDALAVIDFQDAVTGPVTYDPVSLLRDCYIRWPGERVRAWALRHRDRLVRDELLSPVDDERFMRWFDWMGLQRHVKVLGTFARLYLRDGKPGYLDDLPLVIDYVREVLAAYSGREPVFAAYRDWFESTLRPRISAQPWSDCR